MDVILGSASPRRKEILSGILESFRILIPDIDETRFQGEDPVLYSRRMALEKADSLFKRYSLPVKTLIISSDTIVVINGRILGKPSSLENAFEMLKSLNGRTHRVITSVALYRIDSGGNKTAWVDHDITHVTFKKLNDAGIRKYLSMIDYLDKAGAYAMQEHGRCIIEKYEGSITNIIGLPLRLIFRMFSVSGIIGEII
ncbi:MAG: Maf family protein [Spirochaetes bacterium]|jgi:septum formation protein|nr:Maf family protein [Spirochaetota bacterium]